MSQNTTNEIAKQLPSLLVIDDEQAILDTLQDSLVDEGFSVQTLSDGSKTLQAIGDLVPDAVLLDIFMPQHNGLDLLVKIKKEYPKQDVIIISGFGTVPIAVDAVKKGARDFIEKPLNLEEILTKLDFLKHEPKIKVKPELKKSSRILVGESNLFKEFLSQAQRTIPLTTPILLYGQHGSGKTVIAQHIYELSSKKNLPFIIFDCTQPELDFTQAKEAGTVFFKNIHELSEQLQKNALAFISEHHETIRVIASAIPTLFSMVQQQEFNSLLFYKLNITPLEMVPLRKRRYDIPLLVSHFLEQANQKHNKAISLSASSIRILRNYDWPGNVAQLEAFIEKLVMLLDHKQNIVTPELLEELLPEKSTPFIQEQSFHRFDSLEHATKEFESKLIHFLLKKYEFNLEQVSEYLNISAAELQGKINN